LLCKTSGYLRNKEKSGVFIDPQSAFDGRTIERIEMVYKRKKFRPEMRKI